MTCQGKLMQNKSSYYSRNRKHGLILVIILAFLSGCEKAPEQALGTLEWDRVNSRIPASEVIVDILVQEGEQVSAGTILMQVDDRKIAEKYRDFEARLHQASWQLKELEAGPLPQTIAEARARLDAARASLKNSKEIYRRQQNLFKTNFTSREDLDNARNLYLTKKEQANELTENLDKLLAGTRIEQIEQARSRLESLYAQLKQIQLLQEDYAIKATRDGFVDSLPFKKGDRPPAQAVVCTMLAGDLPWARVYIPEPFRSRMLPGNQYALKIDGQQQNFSARLRTISSEPSFTPYFALYENDRSRLSYVAELDVTDTKAGELTAGTPVQLILETK